MFLPYSYNNIIIIVTNVIIILEFLSAQFVHLGALLLFYLFQHELEHKNNESQYIFTKLFSLTTMTPEFSKYLYEELGLFLNTKQQK